MAAQGPPNLYCEETPFSPQSPLEPLLVLGVYTLGEQASEAGLGLLGKRVPGLGYLAQGSGGLGLLAMDSSSHGERCSRAGPGWGSSRAQGAGREPPWLGLRAVLAGA